MGREWVHIYMYELSVNTVMDIIIIQVSVSKSLRRRLQFEVCHYRRIIYMQQ